MICKNTPHNKRVSDEIILESYNRTKSVWKTAKEVGLCGQSVHERLVRLNSIKSTRFTEKEVEMIKELYLSGSGNGPINLNEFCEKIGRHKSTVCKKAKELGLTNIGRSKSEEANKINSEFRKKWHLENPHPKGMLGKHHSKEYCKEISKRVIRWHEEVSPARKREQYVKIIKTKIDKYGSAGNKIEDIKVSWKQGWREVGGKKIYCRSRWEANYARYLEYLKNLGQIKEWDHEPKTFWFEEVKRGCITYLPDFRVDKNDGNHEWHEVKGWMDDRSKTKIKRFKKYYPKEKLILIDSKWYRKNQNILSNIIKDWELS